MEFKVEFLCNTMEFKFGVHYKTGDTIDYNNNTFKCIQTHTSHIEYGTPKETNGTLWTNLQCALAVHGVVQVWMPGLPVVKDDIVLFDRTVYKCLRTHLCSIYLSPPHKRGELWEIEFIENRL
ncbi:hypothetical protein EB118_08805 [bacterium]|nr:hypothetical protein [bacterium]NDC94661.1 hypothetical protein [bacterium]NDD84303.1 hypothetical protein [bacterium]NDG30161.1 hypothetical protein [bacterium]